MDKDLLNLHKKLAPSWEEVLKEQQYYTAALSQIKPKAYKRIKKYGYPKRCPAIKNIINLIIF